MEFLFDLFRKSFNSQNGMNIQGVKDDNLSAEEKYIGKQNMTRASRLLTFVAGGDKALTTQIGAFIDEF